LKRVYEISISNFLSVEEVEQLGLKKFGQNCQIDQSVMFINPSKISLGSDVRIDALSILSPGNGFIQIDDKVHISHSVRIYGAGGVVLKFASGVSSGCAIYSQTDDFLSGHLAHPTIPSELRNVDTREVTIGEFCIIGANSVLLPGAEMGRGSAVAALSVLKQEVGPFEVFGGAPARRIAARNSEVLEELAQKLDLD
jgi:acetyltransferase-like isoleucine patch superfamily enzyme